MTEEMLNLLCELMQQYVVAGIQMRDGDKEASDKTLKQAAKKLEDIKGLIEDEHQHSTRKQQKENDIIRDELLK